MECIILDIKGLCIYISHCLLWVRTHLQQPKQAWLLNMGTDMRSVSEYDRWKLRNKVQSIFPIQHPKHKCTEKPNSPERWLFFSSPSHPLAASKKRKFKDLQACIFLTPHAYFLGNEVLPTLKNSNSYLLLPLGAVDVRKCPVQLYL